MKERFARTRMLVGDEGIEKLWNSRVAVFGLGGVGGYAAEALARACIGSLDLVDKDVVDATNLNRQILALRSTVGRPKVEVMKERIFDLDPEIGVTSHHCFFLPETEFDFSGFDYVVDAIDTVTAKLDLIQRARQAGVPVISSMGTGNKLDPARFEVAAIAQTSVCPLAKVMRRELKKRGITDLKVVYSKEEPLKQKEPGAPASISFVPPAAGLILAGEVVRDLLKKKNLKIRRGDRI